MKEKLLAKRKEMKAKKPKFTRQDAHKNKRLKVCWRRPKGLQSKMRLNRSGYSKCISVGYKSPVEVRGLSKEGLEPIMISNISQLTKITEGQGAIISGTVGQKKRMEIAKKAADLSIEIININDIPAYLKSANEKITKKKEAKQKSVKDKEKKKAEKEKKAESKKKEDLAEKLSDEEKKEKDKKEREKILTTKES